MKKILIVSLLSAGAMGVYAQGTINFTDFKANAVVSHIWSPETDNPSVQVTGDIATAYNGTTAKFGDYPVGTAVYNGQMIGGSSGAAGTPINYSYGNNFTVQIYAAPGDNVALGSLLPVSQYVATAGTTAAYAGQFKSPSITSDPGIPGANNYDATVALACWYNAGGTVNSLSAAQALGLPAGESPAFNVNNLGEPASITGSTPGSPATLIGLQSFSLTTTPEPSTIALGVMGLSAFLIRRRK